MENVINLFKKYYLYFMLAIILIITLINSYFIFYKKENKIIEPIKEIISTSKEENNEFYVDIKGYIKKPGVYLVNENTLVNDLIKKAGGITKSGSTANINLSKKLTSEMVIIINSQKEIAKLTNSVTIKEECICDEVIIDECINNNSDDLNNTKVSINTATKEQLMTLSGIGESKAEAIISYRSENGLFKTIDDIKNVTGIGDSIFAQIKENITI